VRGLQLELSRDREDLSGSDKLTNFDQSSSIFKWSQSHPSTVDDQAVDQEVVAT